MKESKGLSDVDPLLPLVNEETEAAESERAGKRQDSIYKLFAEEKTSGRFKKAGPRAKRSGAVKLTTNMIEKVQYRKKLVDVMEKTNNLSEVRITFEHV